MTMLTVLGLLLVVPSIIALVQEGKEQSSAAIATVCLVTGLIVAGRIHVDLLVELIPRYSIWFKILGSVAGVAGVVAVVKLQNRVVGTLLATAAVLIAAAAFNLIHNVSA